MKQIITISLLLLLPGLIFAQGWTATTAPSSQAGSNNVVEVFFLNADTGMVVTENGLNSYFWYTTNGGDSWTQDTVFTKVNAFSAPNALSAWVCGNSGSLYKGTLGLSGMSWTAQSSGVSVKLNDIHMLSATTGYAVGDLGNFIKTTNGGTSWSNPVISGGVVYNIKAVHFTSTSDGYIAGTNGFNGFIAKTVSGGQYWGTAGTLISAINDIDFPTASVGYLAGNGGTVYKTTNGTNASPSWVIKSTGSTSNLNSLFFLNADTGYVVGDDGLILKTLDGGTTWQSQTLSNGLDVNRVWVVDYQNVYVGMDSNNVYKTNTAGIGLDLSTTDDSVFCSGYVNLQTQLSYNGAGTVSYSWASSTLLSDTSLASPTAGPFMTDQTFYVTATDGTLSDVDSVFIKVVPLITDTICMVTVDDSLGHNVVVFEQHTLGPVAHYNIYRESSVAGVYDSIGFIPADSAGIFIDTNSNPAVQQYSYKISTVDSCGLESALSNKHTTMHLTVNQGVGTTWNLIWTPYEGFPFPTYRIWRSDTAMNWDLIDSVASGTVSYTDLNPPSGGLYYQVEIVSAHICQPYLYSKAQTNYNTSRSNVANNGQVVPPPALSADFSATPTTGVAPLDVQFQDMSTNAQEWLWDFGDGDTSNLASPLHTYTQVGVYTVQLIVRNGTLADTAYETSFIDVLSSIHDVKQKAEIQVFPNPAKSGDEFYVKYKHIRVQAVYLRDIVGREVKTEIRYEQDQIGLKPQGMESGVYILQLMDENKQLHQRKIIIK